MRMGILVAKAKTVLVCFDHKTQATIPVPEAWRTALEALKAHSPFTFIAASLVNHPHFVFPRFQGVAVAG